MKETEREDYLEILQGWDKFKVVAWSIICRKRFYAFDTWWNRGMATNSAFKEVCKMTSKEVRTFYKENHKKIKI